MPSDVSSDDDSIDGDEVSPDERPCFRGPVGRPLTPRSRPSPPLQDKERGRKARRKKMKMKKKQKKVRETLTLD